MLAFYLIFTLGIAAAFLLGIALTRQRQPRCRCGAPAPDWTWIDYEPICPACIVARMSELDTPKVRSR